MKATRYIPPVEERLAAKLAPAANGCIEWTGGTVRGYGNISINRRSFLTHRVAWTLANGPIPDGLLVLHRCDNPPCCNVDHLFLGTQSDNMADMAAKGRGAKNRGEHNAKKTHCPRGHSYDEANTYIAPKGFRTCRTCQKDANRRYQERAKSAS